MSNIDATELEPNLLINLENVRHFSVDRITNISEIDNGYLIMFTSRDDKTIFKVIATRREYPSLVSWVVDVVDEKKL